MMKTKFIKILSIMFAICILFGTAGCGEKTSDDSGKSSSYSLAPINTETVSGDAFSGEDFKKYDLTLVNFFATWCGACVQEIPDLEKLHKDMKNKGVNVVGVVTDIADEKDSSGKVIENQSIIDLARNIQNEAGSSYPFIKPDAFLFDGKIRDITAFPETFFVDNKGNIVGESIVGSHTYKEWKQITEKKLDALKKGE